MKLKVKRDPNRLPGLSDWLLRGHYPRQFREWTEEPRNLTTLNRHGMVTCFFHSRAMMTPPSDMTSP
eukprot:1509453-Heterocapsa_arctica.AAC.1